SAIERQYGRLLKICEADRAREAAERVAADGREADAERYWKRYEAIQKELGVSNRRSDWEGIERYADMLGYNRRGDWASITPLKVPGPPPDPGPREENYYVGGPSAECWHWGHRGQVSLLRMDDGTVINFGYAETPRQTLVYGSVRYDYIGYLHG